jgi:hypothetical protein
MRRSVIILGLMLGLAQPALINAAETLQEVRIRWDVHPGSPSPHVTPGAALPSSHFTILERHQVVGSLPRQRSAELSAEQIVVVAVDGQGREIYRRLIPDPRILRAEHPGPTGELRGQVLHHASTVFRVTLPDDPAVEEVSFYHPRWTGTTFILEWLGAVRLH